LNAGRKSTPAKGTIPIEWDPKSVLRFSQNFESKDAAVSQPDCIATAKFTDTNS
jgi:hypothetical protein